MLGTGFMRYLQMLFGTVCWGVVSWDICRCCFGLFCVGDWIHEISADVFRAVLCWGVDSWDICRCCLGLCVGEWVTSRLIPQDSFWFSLFSMPKWCWCWLIPGVLCGNKQFVFVVMWEAPVPACCPWRLFECICRYFPNQKTVFTIHQTRISSI
jgi:hypothetical protein